MKPIVTKQEKIIQEIAERHNLSYKEAMNVINSLFTFIKKDINNPENRLENGVSIVKNFKCYYIQGFGRFAPKTKRMYHANKNTIKKYNKENESTT